MMNFFKMYLKERMKYILLTMMLIGLFSFTLLLMNVPAKALLYPVLLCLFLGLLVLVTDCAIAKSRKNERANLDKITLSVIDSMPEAHSEEVRDYQNAIRQLGNEYRNYVSESERKYENMMDYYTVWAHQIKTPISSMKLAFQGEDSTLSRRLSVDLFRIEQYVDMVLVYLRLDSEYTDYVFKECNMDEVIKNSVKKFASEFIGRKLSLEYEPEDVTVVNDSKWLEFVIGQIISNSLKYTETGGIKIYFKEPKMLVIEDTGIGIAEEDLPRIFEKGYTGYNGRTDGSASGIGLYLCRRICGNLHIGIQAESEVGKGTKIILDLNQYKLKDE
jgi:two-component system sensor histidine kinase BraS/BceS